MITGHQPAYLPWIGYFARMLECDTFVVVDHVQYEKKGWQNRNVIRSADGQLMLTVPVITHDRFYQRIMDVEIAVTQDWQRKHWLSLYHNYRSADHFKQYSDAFEAVYVGQRWQRLIDLNIALLQLMLDAFDIKIPIVYSSSLGVSGKKTQLLASMCASLDASAILTGQGALGYVDPESLFSLGIEHRLSRFSHPRYPQRYQPFIPNMSAVDLIFNCGPKAKDLVRRSVSICRS